VRLRPVLICLCFVFGIVATLGCSTDADQDQTANSSISIPKILNFTSVQIDGSEFDVATLGGEDVLFWFWDPN